METKSRAGARGASVEAAGPQDEPRVDGYLLAAFPWYGLDETYSGRRWLMHTSTSADGTVEHGSLGHGDEPSKNLEEHDTRRFAVTVTLSRRPVRHSADGTGVLEATSVSSVAWLAGSGLLSCTWPAQMERSLRQDWTEQQTAIAWELADDLGGAGWSKLTLPVDGVPTAFHYRESEYGWVLAGETDEVHLGAYGRGMSAYSLGFSVVKDITEYRD
ncbi:hypothetical protein [Wenjunlia tyrosinilytica]|uniref:Uncharacterized protein n=1 Tax=Wenjunlia tyrosinilytica TaxID=1544741 RepID=A0A917ZL91_9ACTN|nr:hypothetical protein [Wenjunlia tyrosinilytica]GGO85903.1 hypothetical protein GCM10012280_20770 [Wenjunlia tyrosinilytica]